MHKFDTLALLRRHQSDLEEESSFLAQTISFVERQEHFWQRSTLEGHLTGSAWVLSADGSSVLLLHHTKLDRWLQPGGHADEQDDSLVETARREAMEECGLAELTLLSPSIFDIDVHEIPARGHEPTHLHYDLRFLFVAPEKIEIKRNLLETKAIAWVRIAELCAETTPPSLRRMALKTLNIESDSERF
ncbi:MAG: NUDIX hydrolase [Phycisphaerae bacterium]|nr:NUDIX hydrolase [Saprospiraceae bacterium]